MTLQGKHAVMEQFLAEGVKYVFGNPGSTELAFMDGLQLQWLLDPQAVDVRASYQAYADGLLDRIR